MTWSQTGTGKIFTDHFGSFIGNLIVTRSQPGPGNIFTEPFWLWTLSIFMNVAFRNKFVKASFSGLSDWTPGDLWCKIVLKKMKRRVWWVGWIYTKRGWSIHEAFSRGTLIPKPHPWIWNCLHLPAADRFLAHAKGAVEALSSWNLVTLFKDAPFRTRCTHQWLIPLHVILQASDWGSTMMLTSCFVLLPQKMMRRTYDHRLLA